MFEDATPEEINQQADEAWRAFLVYRNTSRKERNVLMHAIADAIDANDEIIAAAVKETNLPESRLRAERSRTTFQLRSYGDACEEGSWLEAKIDTASTNRNPPKPDIRKMNVALGPVAVFGASNFPFAYSTAGGDVASALAAGCTVIVKAHPAHADTSELVAEIIKNAIAALGMPPGIFSHIHGREYSVAQALVEHSSVKAVAFTGSFTGGKQLWDWANSRREPIPVFAEMGSVNPVFLFPEKLKQSGQQLAEMLAGSITLGVGQFCTNPGLIIGIESDALNEFIRLTGEEIRHVSPALMLHSGIFKNYVEKRANALAQHDVEMVAVAEGEPHLNEGSPTLATVSGEEFLANPVLHQEVFGPFSLVIKCRDATQVFEVAKKLEGQLTASVMATENDIRYHEELIGAIKDLCGRFIYNGVPTGVEVCLSMQHGGPYPATTDSRFTSVGPDAIRRFVRPLAYQNWPDELLPPELQNKNPWKLWRTVNNKFTKDNI